MLLHNNDSHSSQDQTVLNSFLGAVSAALNEFLVWDVVIPPSTGGGVVRIMGKKKDVSLEHMSKSPLVDASISHENRQFSPLTVALSPSL